ncbi:MAG: hypothetical protein GY822_14845 [Deltaproteobacteria bacterium]|nr:hypothetical protein [Deltaproteobacteria bacterium]
MLLESIAVFGALFTLSLWLFQREQMELSYSPLAQGFWFQRLYVVGHEAAHRNISSNRLLNDVIGQVFLLPLLVPVNVFAPSINFTTVQTA